MSVRTELALELRREILGPRYGYAESLVPPEDPRNDYITGVLIPREASDDSAKEIEDEAETLGTGTDEYQDDDTDEDIPVAASPVLDPKSLPRSLGISFIVASDGEPVVEICATWARYALEKDPQTRQEYFSRVPQGYVTPDLINASISPQSVATVDQVRISLRSMRLSGHERLYKVSVYLVNETSLPVDSETGKRSGRVETHHLIFQPQIRVNLGKGTTLCPFDSFQPAETAPEPGSIAEEDESLALIYRDQQAYARGHLCGAVWRDIDPERPCNSGQENPLTWIDRHLIQTRYGEPFALKFSLPDCRTEYLPCYPVQAPDIDWRDEEQVPELHAEELSETWQSQAVIEALQPLVNGYRNWINQKEVEISHLEARYHRAAERHIAQCYHAAARMEEAIQLISQDEEVRLAFCFANQAISLQASWRRRGNAFTWRPFQMAFILMNIPAIANPLHEDRQTCDLLAFPTGGGKTEAYLGLAAFTLGLRRLRSGKDTHGHRTGHGVSVISRYTLRLLTIQQFRRALGLIIACEILRVQHTGTSRPSGWRPSECQSRESYIWGTTRFSAGLWVGGNVTPNSLKGGYPPRGGLNALQGEKIEGEPAQVLNCPCCGSILAVPKDGLNTGRHTLHLIVDKYVNPGSLSQRLSSLEELESAPLVNASRSNVNSKYATLTFDFVVKPFSNLAVQTLERWWKEQIEQLLNGANLVAFRITRPGYFPKSYMGARGKENIEDFEIYCPNPSCELNTNKKWNEKVPIPFNGKVDRQIQDPASFIWEQALPQFSEKHPFSSRIPISAYTVDDQIYHRVPSLLVATVDKFARLAFEPKASSIFGNIDCYHSRIGYLRTNVSASELKPKKHFKSVNKLFPPDLILQDELHLIEGPLGSMVGLYETAVDTLCQRQYREQAVRPKYIASTATVRQSQTQVQSLFDRGLFQFPPPALSANDSFFALTPENVHPVEEDLNGQHPRGRLYLAVCAPGKGAQTPLVRIYSSLLQCMHKLRLEAREFDEEACDPFWTLVGYFNAIRELAGALTLYRQDIPERMKRIADTSLVECRPLEQEAVELSSRRDSTELPGLLSSLDKRLPDAGDATKDIVLSTSMFGTGVDIDRLGLMVVNGQPKTTASYIQATGRVGRGTGGLVVTFFRASRPRDLDHYEFFSGYHRAIYRYVEPITVTPFASRARERGMGPVTVAMLRQASNIRGIPISSEWASRSGASHMLSARRSSELEAIRNIVVERSQTQVSIRRPPDDQVDREIRAGFDRWERAAEQEDDLVYEEYAINKIPEKSVVLGDDQHQKQGLTVVFRNSPSSLREVESMTRFGRIWKSSQNTQEK